MQRKEKMLGIHKNWKLLGIWEEEEADEKLKKRVPYVTDTVARDNCSLVVGSGDFYYSYPNRFVFLFSLFIFGWFDR